MYASGVMIGTFEPLHLGHMRSILHASGFVETLHIIITALPSLHPKSHVTLQDKARWIQMACQDLPFIRLYICDELNLLERDNPYDAQIDIHRTRAKIQYTIEKFGLPSDSVLVLNDNHPLTDSKVASQLDCKLLITSTHPEFDTLSIVQDPIEHWHVIHPEARGDYTRTVAIVGGESSGKTTLVHKLANYYGADFALEMGRLYVGTDLGGSEVGLQYSDYAPIALDHAEAVRQAVYQAKAPVTIVDTDFVTTQAFCEEYEGRTHPFVTACIEEFKFDHTIFLANNTPWIADGMRSLGSDNARERFEARLEDIFTRHGIKPYRITSPDYHERFEQAVAFIDSVIFKP